MKFFIIQIKKNLLTIIFALFLIFLIIFSNENLIVAKKSLQLWANNVIPSLFPFFIATELLNYTNIIHIIGKYLKKILQKLFNIPGEGGYAFIMGVISGYPIGAKIVTDLYKKNICTKEQSERMIAFTNNSGPLFIIGTVGILLFGNIEIGILLFITHLLSSISVGIILGIISRYFKINKISSYQEKQKAHQFRKSVSSNFSNSNHTENTTNYSILNLGEILTQSIKSSISNILVIGGFVVLFSIILSILNRIHIISILCKILSKIGFSYNLCYGTICGFIELTNGVNIISNLHTKAISINIILCAFLLGFGGLSILFQVLSIISKEKISIKLYFYGKLLQGILASLYTCVFINNFSILNLDIPSINTINFNLFYIFNFIFIIIILIKIFKYYNKKLINLK